MSGGDKAIDAAIAANPDKMKIAWGLTDFAAHRDLIVRSVESKYGKVPSRARPISDFDSCRIKPGKNSSAMMMFRYFEMPVLDKLVADGVIYAYSLDFEAVHTMEPGMVWLVTILPDLGAKDKVRAAFAELSQKFSVSERDAIQKMEDEIFVPGSHRDQLSEALIFKMR